MEALQRLHNRGSISTGYDIDNSLKIEPDNSEHLTKSQSNGNKKTWTCSFWFKRTELNDSEYPAFISASSSSWQTRIAIFNNGALWVDLGYGTSYYRNITNLLLRDTSAWYHVVVAVDSTQGTASDRLNVYLNGELITSWNTQNYPAQNTEFKFFDSNHAMFIGTTTATDYRFAGYLADMHVVDGTQLAQTDFGEFDDDSGIWKPKAYTGSYGSQGFYLDFSDSANLGDDASGNSNNFTETNIAAADQATDTPTNNFCTLNPLNAINNGGGNNEYTEGATKGKALQESEIASGTMAVAQGKWYYECKGVLNSEIMAGWGVPNKWGNHSSNPGNDNYSFAVHNIGRVYYAGNAYIDISPSVSFDTTDIISVAVDIDNGFAYWAKNGTWMGGGSPTSGSTGTGGFDFQSASAPGNLAIEDGDFLIPAVRTNYHTNSAILLNFGGYTTISISSGASDANGYGTFEYAPPSGYYALCTKNLEEFG